jgi:hypothetical protein
VARATTASMSRCARSDKPPQRDRDARGQGANRGKQDGPVLPAVAGPVPPPTPSQAQEVERPTDERKGNRNPAPSEQADHGERDHQRDYGDFWHCVQSIACRCRLGALREAIPLGQLACRWAGSAFSPRCGPAWALGLVADDGIAVRTTSRLVVMRRHELRATFGACIGWQRGEL